MARTSGTSKAQKETVERVMHAFKEGDLRMRGTGPKVRSPKQAIAIALRAAGASKRESPAKNRDNLRKTKAKERSGEGGGKPGGKRSASPRERLGRQASKASPSRTRAELYAQAKRRQIPGRSRMSKAELERALSR